MLKLFGAVCIVMASYGFVYEWKRKSIKTLGLLKQICDFYGKTVWFMQEEQGNSITFFKNYAKELAAKDRGTSCWLQTFLQELAACLQSHVYPTGEKAFCSVYADMVQEFGGKGQAEKIFLSSAEYFFGFHVRDNIEGLLLAKNRMEQYIDEQEKAQKEKEKVLTPLGVLGGMMLVIILL